MTPDQLLAAAVLGTLEDPDTARRVAELLAPHLPAPPATDAGGYLDSKAAAAYLGLPSVQQLHKLTAARAIAFHQDGEGAKCYFSRADLDAYRAQHRRPAQP
jgi:hypothetical protein